MRRNKIYFPNKTFLFRNPKQLSKTHLECRADVSYNKVTFAKLFNDLYGTKIVKLTVSNMYSKMSKTPKGVGVKGPRHKKFFVKY